MTIYRIVLIHLTSSPLKSRESPRSIHLFQRQNEVSHMNPSNVLRVIPCSSLMAMQYVFDLLLVFYSANPRKSIIKNSLQSSLSVVGFMLYLLLHIHEMHLHLLLLSVYFKFQTRLSTNFGFCI